ncbi:hypothetical protein THRCLA_01715 [Thraustotheca clavata]|uniref:N-acetyltransferase domain-containing protein n=1 Tax=Thraustotheca clavata TaxID=74557 RepID=A0A1W0A7H1_9STRA|nr:hypothetical protein THRCLA_01715 [Thraustotheca clavata]
MAFTTLPTSYRLTYLSPKEERDQAVYSIFCEDDNMKYIPFLCRMQSDAWQARRSSHRELFNLGTGAFLDVIETSSGKVIGTSGFRVVDKENKQAEWGVILSQEFQGKGYCKEMHDACIAWAKTQGLERVTAATWQSNDRMNQLLLRYGWTFIETRTDELGIWNEYELSL